MNQHRLRAPLAYTALVVFAVVAVGWLLFRSATGAEGPTCGAITAVTCVGVVTLDVGAIETDQELIVGSTSDVSPDGTVVAVALVGPRLEGQDATDSFAAVFDVATGDLVDVLLQSEGNTQGLINTLRFSPDGSHIVVDELVDGSTSAHVFDRSSGARTVVPLVESHCRNALFMSTDNSMVQCQSSVYDIEGGERVVDFDDGDPANSDLVDLRNTVFARHLSFDAFDIAVWNPNDDTIDTKLSPSDSPDSINGGDLEVNGTGLLLAQLGSRRVRIYDITSGEVVGEFVKSEGFHGSEWGGQYLMAINDDFEVIVVRVEPGS